MYLYLVYVLCCLVLNTLKTFEIADLYGIITAKQLLYRAMPNGSPLTRQPPSDGQLYHTASRTWYNNRRAVIIPGLCPTARRLRGNRLLMGNYTMPLRGHGIITAERLLYQSYGQGDSRARPAAAPMADYTMPLRGHGIIIAARLLYQSYGQGDTRAARFRFGHCQECRPCRFASINIIKS